VAASTRHGDFERGRSSSFGGRRAVQCRQERRQSDLSAAGSAGNTTVLSGGIEIVSSGARRAACRSPRRHFEFFGGANYSNLFTGSGAIVHRRFGRRASGADLWSNA